MYSLTPFDVSNLNRSIEGIGQAFAERRREQEQHSRDVAQELLRQKMLETEQRRADVEKNAANIAAEGKTTTYLYPVDEDGEQADEPTQSFTGPPSGLQNYIKLHADQGKTLVPGPEPQRKKAFSIKSSVPGADIEVFANDPDQLSSMVKQMQDMGGRAPTQHGASSQYGPIMADQKASELEAQAEDLERQYNQLPEASPQGDVLQAAAASLRSRAQNLRQPRMQMPWQTTTQDIFAPPAYPGAPPQKTGTVTTRSPVGATPATPAGPGVPRGTKPLDAATAAQFLQKAGGDKEKARQMARDAGFTF
jgi:hypothetical protein